MLLFRKQLPFSRSLYCFNCCRYSSSTSSPSVHPADPLRILFCGSDEFSIASLRALHAHQKREPRSIASIDVVHRPPKLVGRGLKKLSQVPIQQTVEELKLRSHVIDTFTGWTPPATKAGPINLVIAVSFGLLVPPRILNAAKYGGLNVHPSLLPDLRGPAPIHHTLLKRRKRTGITVQTLHPQNFDQGMILAQTPPPGLQVTPPHSRNPTQLRNFLAPVGAAMLVDVIKGRSFVPPLRSAGWYPATESDPVDYAGKISKNDSRIDWASSDMDDLLIRKNVFGELWCMMPFEVVRGGKKEIVERRVIIHQMDLHQPNRRLSDYGKPGLFVEDTAADDWPNVDLLALTGDFKDLESRGLHSVLKINSCTVDGGKKGKGRMEILNQLQKQTDSSPTS